MLNTFYKYKSMCIVCPRSGRSNGSNHFAASAIGNVTFNYWHSPQLQCDINIHSSDAISIFTLWCDTNRRSQIAGIVCHNRRQLPQCRCDNSGPDLISNKFYIISRPAPIVMCCNMWTPLQTGFAIQRFTIHRISPIGIPLHHPLALQLSDCDFRLHLDLRSGSWFDGWD